MHSLVMVSAHHYAPERCYVSAGEITELPRWWGGVEYRYRVDPEASGHGAGLIRAPTLVLADRGQSSGLTRGLLSQPSVRFRKTINTMDGGGDLIAVNAQK